MELNEKADELAGDETERLICAETIVSVLAPNASNSLEVGVFFDRADQLLFLKRRFFDLRCLALPWFLEGRLVLPVVARGGNRLATGGSDCLTAGG